VLLHTEQHFFILGYTARETQEIVFRGFSHLLLAQEQYYSLLFGIHFGPPCAAMARGTQERIFCVSAHLVLPEGAALVNLLGHPWGH
jgi:hypothetical protein